MKDIQVFNNPEFGELRTIEEGDKIYFVASDAAKMLGYKRPADAVTAHCKGSVKRRLPTNGGMQEMKVIPEGDLYRLIANSELPSAEKFESWVFDEVLPAIRKTGGYHVPQSPEEQMAQGLLAAQKLLDMLPADLRPAYDEALSPSDPGIEELVSAADKLSAHIKCLEELKAGNSEFKKAAEQTRAALERFDLPELRCFCEEFLPSFELALDEMD